MKKTLLYALTGMAVISSNLIQAQKDIGVTAISDPVAGQSIDLGIQNTILFTIANFATTPFLSSDTVFLSFQFNGADLQVQKVFLANDIPASSSVNVSFDIPVISNGYQVNGTGNFCVGAAAFNDADNSNFGICVTGVVFTGIEEQSIALSHIYTSNGMLNFDISGGVHYNNAGLSIYDITGRVVSQRKGFNLSQAAQSIDISGLSKGVYFLNIYSGTTSLTTKKFVVN